MSRMRSQSWWTRLTLRSLMIHVAFTIAVLVILYRGDREATESRYGTPLLMAIVLVSNLGILYAYVWYVAGAIRKRHNPNG